MGAWSGGGGGSQIPTTPKMATAAVGTRPTGMHSCSQIHLHRISLQFLKLIVLGLLLFYFDVAFLTFNNIYRNVN